MISLVAVATWKECCAYVSVRARNEMADGFSTCLNTISSKCRCRRWRTQSNTQQQQQQQPQQPQRDKTECICGIGSVGTTWQHHWLANETKIKKKKTSETNKRNGQLKQLVCTRHANSQSDKVTYILCCMPAYIYGMDRCTDILLLLLLFHIASTHTHTFAAVVWCVCVCMWSGSQFI